jgi:hypothetical protein
MTRKRWYMIGVLAAAGTAMAILSAGITHPVSAQQSGAAGQSPADRYASLMADSGSIERYNADLQQLISAQQSDIQSLNAQIAGLDGTKAAVGPLLQRMYDGLTKFVAQDLPFLTDERQARLGALATIMATDGDYFNKYRRLMDAYQIELDFGRTMSAYRAKLPDGRDADFVHVGRVSLLYRTVDGSESGYWDASAHKWVADPDYSRAILDAIKMAKEQIAADLIAVPVPAAGKAGM